MKDNEYIGRIVYSKSGRDAKRYFIVVGALNEEYVYIADGRLRTVSKPKKKKVKHLIFTGEICDELAEAINSGVSITDSQLRDLLRSEDTNKEV